MRASKTFVAMLLVLCTLLFIGLSQAALDPGIILQLSDNVTDDINLETSSANAVWQAADPDGDQEIFLFVYDNNEITQLTNNLMDDVNPTISGTNVAWQAWDGNDWEIFVYNGMVTTQLTDNDANDVNPKISKPLVFWQGSDGNDLEIFTARIPPQPVELSCKITPRSLNLKSKGKWVTCLIRFPDGVDAVAVDTASILLQGEIPPDSVKVSKRRNKILLKFSRSALQALLAPGSEVEVTVSCTSTDGTPIICSDTIKVLLK